MHHYLGIQFKQCDGGIALCQTKHIEALLHRFDFEDYKPIATPIEIGHHLKIHDVEAALMPLSIKTTTGCWLPHICKYFEA